MLKNIGEQDFLKLAALINNMMEANKFGVLSSDYLLLKKEICRYYIIKPQILLSDASIVSRELIKKL